MADAGVPTNGGWSDWTMAALPSGAGSLGEQTGLYVGRDTVLRVGHVFEVAARWRRIGSTILAVREGTCRQCGSEGDVTDSAIIWGVMGYVLVTGLCPECVEAEMVAAELMDE